MTTTGRIQPGAASPTADRRPPTARRRVPKSKTQRPTGADRLKKQEKQITQIE